MARHTIFSIEHDENEHQLLHVILISATQMSFDISFAGRDFRDVIRDICGVAPSIMQVDSDLAEAFDDAFRTQPNPIQVYRINKFVNKYRDALSNVDLSDIIEGLDSVP
jgi:hypothetical protein